MWASVAIVLSTSLLECSMLTSPSILGLVGSHRIASRRITAGRWRSRNEEGLVSDHAEGPGRRQADLGRVASGIDFRTDPCRGLSERFLDLCSRWAHRNNPGVGLLSDRMASG